MADLRSPPSTVDSARLPAATRALHHLPWWPPALDMALGGLNEIQALSAIDPHVIEAMAFWLKPDLSDFGTLSRQFQQPTLAYIRQVEAELRRTLSAL